MSESICLLELSNERGELLLIDYSDYSLFSTVNAQKENIHKLQPWPIYPTENIRIHISNNTIAVPAFSWSIPNKYSYVKVCYPISNFNSKFNFKLKIQ